MTKKNLIFDIIDSTRNTTDFNEVMNIILRRIQKYTGFSSVGIRIENSVGDYPYYVYNGFSHTFLHTENSLCSMNAHGTVIRDMKGYPVLDCMCGNVIQKRFDSILPFFTKRGSFWTNSTTELLKGSSEEERQARTRNKCNAEGYESVGLFPLPLGRAHSNLGLLQLNDTRKNMFNKEKIKEYELLARYIGSIVHQAKTIKDLTELKQELQNLSITDDLTGLCNRRGFFMFAEQQIRLCQRQKMKAMLFFIDLDAMKYINDTFGHMKGDEALIEIAHCIKRECRKSDVAARMGGDEFAVFAVGVGPGAANAFVNRLQLAIDAVNENPKRAYALSISIGTAVFDYKKHASLQQLLTTADKHMYMQKKIKHHLRGT